MAEVADQVAQQMRAAAEALEAAASAIPNCDCAHLDADRMTAVVGDLVRAKAAADAVHMCLRRCGRAATLLPLPAVSLPCSNHSEPAPTVKHCMRPFYAAWSTNPAGTPWGLPLWR